MAISLKRIRRGSLGHIAMIIIMIGVVIFAFSTIIDWAFWNATWVGQSKADCHKEGACWAVIYARWDQIIYGFYPNAQRWRVNLALLLLLPIAIYSLARSHILLRHRISLFLLVILAMVYLLYGGGILTVVPTEQWGGLFLTIVLSVSSMVFSFPIAIFLALGRNSNFIIIKPLCVTFIEVVRGVPLVSILFMSAVMFPLFFSTDVVIDNLFCVFVGMTLFQAAYLAEVIRAGLNSVAKGQVEAAASLGMNYSLTMALIILPQALKTAVPGIVNSFIALFKDTTLVLIIGIYDFLGIVQAAATDPKWLGTALEAYLFCALVYWLICFSMSLYSKRLERK